MPGILPGARHRWGSLGEVGPTTPDGQAVWPLGSSCGAVARSVEAAQGPGTRPEPTSSDPGPIRRPAPSRLGQMGRAATRVHLPPGRATAQGSREEGRALQESCSAWLSARRDGPACLRPGGPPLVAVLPQAAPVDPEASARALSTGSGGRGGGESSQAARRQVWALVLITSSAGPEGEVSARDPRLAPGPLSWPPGPPS